MIEIWEPNWGRRTAMIDRYKVKTDNVVVFTKAPSLPGEYRIAGSAVKRCPLVWNGKIWCYDVPLALLNKVKEPDTRQEALF